MRATSFRDSWRTLQSLLLMPSATFAGILAVRVWGPWSSSSLGGTTAGTAGTFFAAVAGSLLLGDAGGTRDTVVFFDGDAAGPAAAVVAPTLLEERSCVGEGGGELLGFFAAGCWVASRVDFFAWTGTAAAVVGWRFSCVDEDLADIATAGVVAAAAVFVAAALEDALADVASPDEAFAAAVLEEEEVEGFVFLPLRARTFSRRFVSEVPLRAAVILASGTNSWRALMHFPVSSRTSEFSCVIVVLNGPQILSTLASSCVGSAAPNFAITFSRKVSVWMGIDGV